jgi:hypothetical protein
VAVCPSLAIVMPFSWLIWISMPEVIFPSVVIDPCTPLVVRKGSEYWCAKLT